MAEKKIYPFFGDKERASLEANGYKIISVEYTPAIRGHGGDAIVAVQKSS